MAIPIWVMLMISFSTNEGYHREPVYATLRKADCKTNIVEAEKALAQQPHSGKVVYRFECIEFSAMSVE